MCYICVLMGLPPTVESAIQLFGKHSLSATKFLETIDPLSLPMRNVRKATVLKEKLIDTSPVDENASSQRFAPEWKLRNWIKLFHILAEALIVVYNIRKDRMGGSITSLMSSTDALPVLPNESIPASEFNNNNDNTVFDETSYQALIRSKFCYDLLTDQTCFDFWRIVFADGDSTSDLEVIESTVVTMPEQDVLFIDVAVDEYNVDAYFEEQTSDTAPPTPIDVEIKLGLERATAASAAHQHANDTHRRGSFGRAASMPAMNPAGYVAINSSQKLKKLDAQQQQPPNAQSHEQHNVPLQHQNNAQNHQHGKHSNSKTNVQTSHR